MRYGRNALFLLLLLSPAQTFALNLNLEPVASGLCSPVALTHAGDGTGRRFIVDQCGAVRILEASGNLIVTPFLDVTGSMVAVNAGFDERGLLGLAFHPNYTSNGRLFVRYGVPRIGGPQEPCTGTARGCHTERLSEFAVSGNPDVANAGSEVVLFEIDEPEFNHNSGAIAFGPDGLLYFGLGDGGGANDGLGGVDPPPHGPGGNGQNTETALGAVLRIDVDSAPDPGLPYAIPPQNPFASGAGVDEIYAYGLRNPYRFSFDDGPGGNGALYVADVGQDLFEELDIVTVGKNYGWVIREGAHCFDPNDTTNPPVSCATTGSLGEVLVGPVLEYDHGVGLAIVGGFVYRGSRVPSLIGRYVFGDFGTGFVAPGDGHLFFADLTGPEAFVRQDIGIGPNGDPLSLFVKGIGEDEDGELYVLAGPGLGPSGTTGVALTIMGAAGTPVPSLPSSWGALFVAALVAVALARYRFGRARA